jgi:hypothetical protein
LTTSFSGRLPLVWHYDNGKHHLHVSFAKTAATCQQGASPAVATPLAALAGAIAGPAGVLGIEPAQSGTRCCTGACTGLLPGPPKRLSTLLLALCLKVNVPAALLATLYSNPLTILPLYFLAYSCGLLLLGTPLQVQ